MSGVSVARRVGLSASLAVLCLLLLPALFTVAQEPPSATTTPPPASTTPAQTPTPTASPESSFQLLFTDSFDDENYTANFWTFDAGWEQAAIGEGGQVLQVSGSDAPVTFVHDTLLDAAIQARFLVSAGAVRFSLRQSAAGAYTVTLTADGIVMLTRGADVLGMASSTVAPNAWHTIRLAAVGGDIEVEVDGASVITAQDVAPLPAGTVSFMGQNLGEATLLVDDFALWITDEQENSPTPTETPLSDMGQWTLLMNDNFDQGFQPSWMVDEVMADSFLVEHEEGQAVRFARYAPALLSHVGGLDDQVIQFDVLVQAGCARLTLGHSSSGEYRITFCEDGQLTFYDNSMLRGVAEIPLISGQWFTVRITKTGEAITVEMNDSIVASITDSSSFPSGTFFFLADGADEENVYLIDNFALWVPSSEIAPRSRGISSTNALSVLSSTPDELTSGTGFIGYPREVVRNCTYAGAGSICVNNSLIFSGNSNNYGSTYYDPDWSPDGDRFVYGSHLRLSMSFRETLIIAAINEEGMWDRQASLRTGFGSDTYIRSMEWSPDGSKIVFSAQADQYGTDPTDRSYALYYVNADCTTEECEAIPITADGLDTNDFSPSWSPDSQYIAFRSSRGSQIYTVHYSGAGLQTVGPALNSNEFVADPTWSPDGEEIAFSQGQGPYPYAYSIRVLNLTSGQIRQVTYPVEGVLEKEPEWSPDGTALLFARVCTSNNGYCIYSVEADDDGMETGTLLQFSGSGPSWWEPEGGVEADIALSMTVDNPQPHVGDTIVFTLTATNLGPHNSYDVKIADVLPPGLTYLQHWLGANSPYGPYDPVTGLWDARHIGPPTAPSHSSTLYIRATVTSQGTFHNEAELVSLYARDPNLTNNAASVYVQAYDLAIQFSDDFETFDDTVWTLPANWNYVQTVDRPNMGLFVMEHEVPIPYGSETYDDVAVQARFWAEVGSGVISVRNDTEGLAYNLALDADGNVSLYRGDELVDSSSVDNILYGPPWHTVKLVAIDDDVTAIVDEVVLFTWTDPEPLPAGTVQLTTFRGEVDLETVTGVFVDDFELWVPEDEVVVLGPVTPNPLTIPATDAPHGLLRPAQPEMSPETTQLTTLGGPIVFQMDRAEEGATDIYLLDPSADDPVLVQLTDDPAHDGTPALSPDGSTVAYSHWEADGCTNIYLMDVATREPRLLTSKEYIDYPCYNDQPDWSPDGTQIVFVSREKGEPSSLEIINVDGTPVRGLLNDSYFDHAPAWSPDGTQLAFVSFRADPIFGTGNFPATFLVDATDVYGIPSQIGALFEMLPAWSPDGTRIAVNNLLGEMVTYAPDGTDRLDLNEIGWHPTWSPDGQSIAYQTLDLNVNPIQFVIAVTAASGGDGVSIDDTRGGYFPDWGRMSLPDTNPCRDENDIVACVTIVAVNDEGIPWYSDEAPWVNPGDWITLQLDVTNNTQTQTITTLTLGDFRLSGWDDAPISLSPFMYHDEATGDTRFNPNYDVTAHPVRWPSVSVGPSESFSEQVKVQVQQAGFLPLTVELFLDDNPDPGFEISSYVIPVKLTALTFGEVYRAVMFWMIYNETSEDGYRPFQPEGFSCIEEQDSENWPWDSRITHVEHCEENAYLEAQTIINGFLGSERRGESPLGYMTNFGGSINEPDYPMWDSRHCQQLEPRDYAIALDLGSDSAAQWLLDYYECRMDDDYPNEAARVAFQQASTHIMPEIDRAIQDFYGRCDPLSDEYSPATCDPTYGAYFLKRASHWFENITDDDDPPHTGHNYAYTMCVGGCTWVLGEDAHGWPMLTGGFNAGMSVTDQQKSDAYLDLPPDEGRCDYSDKDDLITFYSGGNDYSILLQCYTPGSETVLHPVLWLERAAINVIREINGVPVLELDRYEDRGYKWVAVSYQQARPSANYVVPRFIDPRYFYGN